MSDSSEELSSSEEEEEEHRFSKSWDGSDVICIAQDQQFHVHSYILCFASPVFKEYFKDNEVKYYDFENKNKSSVLTLLNLMYPNDYKIADLDFNSCKEVLEIAREYKMKRLIPRVDRYVSKKKCGFKWLELAEEFQLERTKKKNIKFFIREDEKRKFTESWNNISDETKLNILLSKISNLDVDEKCCKCKKKYKIKCECKKKKGLPLDEIIAVKNTAKAFE
ncbi:uncharacterized protein LOC130647680 isoform X2 [Hydractinia symbiolongicarpus]|uniref:uncharacterized protein LOC130647680 isoform X2 n=1 Tax=Hydractinia symbiolongicarpus TaxID=13093 RepID=UPI00254C5687|nr:uncharacterized protein LOC130647680 isoform X2 [Hydractinia symbiolongicarpus]XP_057309604.1 uncharacterized protein LOC130647680 isoform X2 [Hydractinia symbiolongicarpus]